MPFQSRRVMRKGFSARWVFQGWIMFMLVAFCTQAALENGKCNQRQYLKDKKCCSKCKPGEFMTARCTNRSDTRCQPCKDNEYQPDWNQEERCHSQNVCDEGRGFKKTKTINLTALVPCECRPGFQCSILNCVFCEKVEECEPGYGVTLEESGRTACMKCTEGFFSNVTSAAEPCKPWTDCRALGKTEEQPGNEKTDAVCGVPIPPFDGNGTLLGVVIGLSVIIVISFVMLLLVCKKDKLKPLSENLRSCVLNLKRSRKPQETTSSYEAYGGPHTCSRYETTCLIRNEESAPDSLNTCSNAGLPSGDRAPVESDEGCESAGSSSSGSGEPSEYDPSPPTASSSCSCVLSLKEPMEVGENEDCSQAVASGISRSCSCDGESGAGAAGHLQEPPSCGGAAGSPSCPCGRGPRLDPDSRGRHRSGNANEPCCCSTDSTSALGDSAGDVSLEDLNSERKSPGHDTRPPRHTAEPPSASGSVTGNNNTTFISNGQVMNFTGDVIVVYVRQNSHGSSGTPEDGFASPVQEETGAPSFPGSADAKEEDPVQGNAARPLQEETRHRKEGPLRNTSVPVQEESNEWTQQKCV
ncbi:tumor necrosis factor receptor superfamily member 11A [Lepisosteus oculatus]|uniref:tumor necrosis factor receptor superfamily member 11A n=1 Tax=Lepisosteus oculatus TaxID=7918 RepID=UPI00371E0560